MSPEQARGQDIDHRTDIWSFGVVLYEMVAGRSPFAASSSSDTLAAILDREPPPVARFEPEVSAELQRILTKALRKDRSHRYQTMQDFLLDLEALRDDLRTLARSGSGPLTRAATATALPTPGGSAHLPAVRPRSRLAVGTAALGLGAIVATTLWWWTARHPVQPQSASDAGPVQRNLTRLTFGEGLQTDVTFSPDGHFIAYASDRAGNFDIWVQPVAGGDAVQITKAPEADTQPAWSPDGGTIAFRSERDGGGVFLVSALGGHERRLAVAGEWPRWSPDGSQVLVQTEAPQSIELWIVRPGEAPRPVLVEFMKDGRFWWAHWHPDGRVSLAGQHRDRGAGFYTLPLEGGEPASSSLAPPVEHLVRNLRQSRFAWSRDGRHVIVEASPRPGVQNLWRVAIEPGSLTWTNAERLTNGPNVDTQATLSADGTVLAYTIATQSYRLHGYDMPARGVLSGRGTALTPAEEWALTPDISRDGTRLVYLAVQPGARVHPQLWVVDLVTGERHAGPTDGALRTNPAWSADGTLLAYAYDRPDGVGEDRKRGALVVRDGAGRERFLSTRRDGALYPWGWTPDGRHVTASMQRLTAPVTVGLWAAARTDQLEPERVLLSQPRTDFWQARVSPDGRWVAFVVASRDDAGARVAVAPIDDTEPARWRHLPARIIADKPRWAHDGRSLYFLGRTGRSSMHLWRVPFDASAGRWVGDPVQLTDFSSPEFEINPDLEATELSVTAKQVFLTMRSTSGSIWMLDNVDR
jgi:Tol biopolymer transport system component